MGPRLPHLSFSRDEMFEIRSAVVSKMSISGVQDKLSLRLERGGKLVPTADGGQYILRLVVDGVVRSQFEASGRFLIAAARGGNLSPYGFGHLHDSRTHSTCAADNKQSLAGLQLCIADQT